MPRRAYQAGIVLLGLLGASLVTGPLAAAIAGQPGGWALVLVGIPLIVLGVAGLRGIGAAVRLSGVVAALACGGLLLLIATTPLRGLTPAPGSPTPTVEPVSLLAGSAFILVAALLAFGTPHPRS